MALSKIMKNTDSDYLKNLGYAFTPKNIFPLVYFLGGTQKVGGCARGLCLKNPILTMPKIQKQHYARVVYHAERVELVCVSAGTRIRQRDCIAT